MQDRTGPNAELVSAAAALELGSSSIRRILWPPSQRGQ